MESGDSAPRFCPRPECSGVVLHNSLQYHNRLCHQDTLTLKYNDASHVVTRDSSSKLFTCPLCFEYTNINPELVKKHCKTCKGPHSTEPRTQQLPRISNDDYHREPDPSTIVYTESVDLSNLNLVVHTILKVAICLSCHKPMLPPSMIPEHVHSHIPELRPAQTVADTLIDPVFGIPLLEEPHHFCDKCHCGFHRLSGIQTHQSGDRCSGQTHHLAYGQMIPGINRRIIEVDIANLRMKQDIQLDYERLFRKGITPTRDYSKIPVPIPENRSNLSSFFYRDGWLEHVHGYTPEALLEARRLHQDDKKHGPALRKAAERYIRDIQPKVRANAIFGLLKDVGSTDADKKFSFRELGADSVITYSQRLHCLIFNCIRFYIQALQTLEQALDEEKDSEEIDLAFHNACFALLAHEKGEYEVSRLLDTNFFSPVICFLVLHCINENGGTPNSSGISNIVAPIMYAIRICIFKIVPDRSKKEKVLPHTVLADYERYLHDRHDTPMSFAYNASCILRVIRKKENNISSFTFTDALGTELSYHGHLINLDMIKRMVEGQLDKYHQVLRQHFFFGEEIPHHLIPDFEIEKLVDDVQNRSTGYTFIEDPRNLFAAHKTTYGIWFLSDEGRRTRFTYHNGTELVWKPKEEGAEFPPQLTDGPDT